MIAFGHKIEIDKNPNNLTNEELFDFCLMNKSLRIERDANQNLLIMAPVGGGSGFRELEFLTEINIWKRKNGGISFSSSTGFFLPNGAMRSPDACWVSAERWASVAIEQQEKFPPIAPDFIVEVRSKTDGLQTTKDKMQEWIENGVRLAWLVDVHNQQTFIYRENGSIEIIEGFDKILNGENVMTGFTFDLKQLEIK